MHMIRWQLRTLRCFLFPFLWTRSKDEFFLQPSIHASKKQTLFLCQKNVIFTLTGMFTLIPLDLLSHFLQISRSKSVIELKIEHEKCLAWRNFFDIFLILKTYWLNLNWIHQMYAIYKVTLKVQGLFLLLIQYSDWTYLKWSYDTRGYL